MMACFWACEQSGAWKKQPAVNSDSIKDVDELPPWQMWKCDHVSDEVFQTWEAVSSFSGPKFGLPFLAEFQLNTRQKSNKSFILKVARGGAELNWK